LRITIKKGDDSNELEIVGAKTVVSKEAARLDGLRRTLELNPLSPIKDKEKRTIVHLGQLEPNVPFDRVSFEIQDEEFVRRVCIQASTHKKSWFSIGCGVVNRIKDTAGKDKATQYLHIDITPTKHKFIRAVFEDRDDTPLKIENASIAYPVEQILFRTKSGGIHTLFIGNKEAEAPSYDFGSIINRSDEIEFTKTTINELAKNTRAKKALEIKPVPLTKKDVKTLLGTPENSEERQCTIVVL